MLAKLQQMVIDFLNVVQAANHSYLPDGILDTLVEPTQRGALRIDWLALAPGPGLL
uniref:Uncharacterized protein n=1 Tax=Candidatus Kentrum sp. FW TaxID=2126338 RepID=A0A450TKK3_9GAMM|nr:MAG: hypothetical protein BECKFW1821B_GA0114236_11414 [Candidatus Kentron sp. FW]